MAITVQRVVRIVCAVIYIISWLTFSLGFIMYYPILDHLRRLQLLTSTGVLIVLPLFTFSVPGLGIGILLVFHIISKRTNRKYIYVALIMLFSVPYLTAGGVNIIMAGLFIATIRHDATNANGVAVEWVMLILIASMISIASYWVSVIIIPLSHRTKALYVSRELIRTSEYQQLP